MIFGEKLSATSFVRGPVFDAAVRANNGSDVFTEETARDKSPICLRQSVSLDATVTHWKKTFAEKTACNLYDKTTLLGLFSTDHFVVLRALLFGSFWHQYKTVTDFDM